MVVEVDFLRLAEEASAPSVAVAQVLLVDVVALVAAASAAAADDSRSAGQLTTKPDPMSFALAVSATICK